MSGTERDNGVYGDRYSDDEDYVHEEIRDLEAKGYFGDPDADDDEVVEAELVEEGELEVDEFADIPQGKPTGTRLFEGAERQDMPCSTCGGQGWYEITIFTPPDENGERQPEQRKKGCATCYGTGRETVVALG